MNCIIPDEEKGIFTIETSNENPANVDQKAVSILNFYQYISIHLCFNQFLKR